MNVPHDKFCVLPWVSLETSPIGTVRPCCLADDEIVSDSGHKCRLDTHDFDTIRNTRHHCDHFLEQKVPCQVSRCAREVFDRHQKIERCVTWQTLQTQLVHHLAHAATLFRNLLNLRQGDGKYLIEISAHVPQQNRRGAGDSVLVHL